MKHEILHRTIAKTQNRPSVTYGLLPLHGKKKWTVAELKTTIFGETKIPCHSARKKLIGIIIKNIARVCKVF